MVIRYEGKVVGDANVHTSPKFLLVCCWGFYTACKAVSLILTSFIHGLTSKSLAYVIYTCNLYACKSLIIIEDAFVI